MDTQQFLVSVNHDFLLHYQCRNCGHTTKTFAIRLVEFLGGESRVGIGRLVKMGEEPAFGPPLPARLQRLVQPDRDLLVKGYQAEIHGQGIGAFAYYRRIVEDGKDRLIDEIIKTSWRKVCIEIWGSLMSGIFAPLANSLTSPFCFTNPEAASLRKTGSLFLQTEFRLVPADSILYVIAKGGTPKAATSETGQPF
jgi:hypothetical protein